LRELWKALGHAFTPEAWGRIHDESVVAMQRCESCGFRFFDPSLAGSEAFYRELEHEEYFSPARPEFARTVKLIRALGLKRVLDVGCGSGAFLDLARKAGCETCGLELNGAAAEKARAKGHTIYNRQLGELAAEHASGGFDLITFFQVLEHVPDPIGRMREAAVLLNPDGYVSVAVPSAEGVYRLVPWDPHQWPPHHLSRWRLADLEQVARAARVRLVESGGDVLVGSDFEHFWKTHNRLAPVLGKRGHWGGDGMGKLISFVYRKTGMKFVFPRWGSSIYGCFKKRA